MDASAEISWAPFCLTAQGSSLLVMNNLSPQGMISWMLLVKERQRLRDLKILQINNAYFKLPALTWSSMRMKIHRWNLNSWWLCGSHGKDELGSMRSSFFIWTIQVQLEMTRWLRSLSNLSFCGLMHWQINLSLKNRNTCKFYKPLMLPANSKVLSTRFVRIWREKHNAKGETIWLRRSLPVSLEFERQLAVCPQFYEVDCLKGPSHRAYSAKLRKKKWSPSGKGTHNFDWQPGRWFDSPLVRE